MDKLLKLEFGTALLILEECVEDALGVAPKKSEYSRELQDMACSIWAMRALLEKEENEFNMGGNIYMDERREHGTY